MASPCCIRLAAGGATRSRTTGCRIRVEREAQKREVGKGESPDRHVGIGREEPEKPELTIWLTPDAQWPF